MASIQHQFFMGLVEAVPILLQCVERSEARFYRQLRLPGSLLESVDVTALSSLRSPEDLPPRPPFLLLTHQEFAAGPVLGRYQDQALYGVIAVQLPFESGDRLYLGRVAAHLMPDQPQDAELAKELAKRFRKAAPPGRLLAKSLHNGASVPARGLGCSDLILDAVRHQRIKLRQWGGTESVEFVPAE
jgi:hypothetical protein